MTKKSTRIKAPSLATRAAFEATIDELARIQVELRHAEASRDERLQAVRDECEPIVLALQEQREGLALAAEKFANDHRDELFPGKVKSADTALAVFGFRLGLPTLKLLNRSWTWERVVKAVKEWGLAHCVRVREEADKDALKQLAPDRLALVGCRVEQVETFFVEPKDQPETAAA